MLQIAEDRIPIFIEYGIAVGIVLGMTDVLIDRDVILTLRRTRKRDVFICTLCRRRIGTEDA